MSIPVCCQIDPKSHHSALYYGNCFYFLHLMRLNEIFTVQWFSGFLNLSPILRIRLVWCVNACSFTFFDTRANAGIAFHYVFHVVIGEPRAPTGQHKTFSFRMLSSSTISCFVLADPLCTSWYHLSCWWNCGRDDGEFLMLYHVAKRHGRTACGKTNKFWIAKSDEKVRGESNQLHYECTVHTNTPTAPLFRNME